MVIIHVHIHVKPGERRGIQTGDTGECAQQREGARLRTV